MSWLLLLPLLQQVRFHLPWQSMRAVAQSCSKRKLDAWSMNADTTHLTVRNVCFWCKLLSSKSGLAVLTHVPPFSTTALKSATSMIKL